MRALRTSAITDNFPPVILLIICRSFAPLIPLILHTTRCFSIYHFYHFFMDINSFTKAVMQSPQRRIPGAPASHLNAVLASKLGLQNWGESVAACDARCGKIGSGRAATGTRASATCVTRFCVCTGRSARASLRVRAMPGGVRPPPLPGHSHAHAYRRAALSVRRVSQALHAEVQPQYT